MKGLLITLGHSSSAVFVNGNQVIGYEEERLTGVKADSEFPSRAISQIINNVGYQAVKGSKIFVSHWFNFDKNGEAVIPNKYITEVDLNNLMAISKDITFVSPEFTHHDAHAYSAIDFFVWNFNKKLHKFNGNNTVYTIVADGFGNNEEVISVYKIEDFTKNTKPELVNRIYGFDYSIGLMYQYATSYTGMKENQDEYKFLGYEAHIDEYLDDNKLNLLHKYVDKTTQNMWHMSMETKTKPVIDKKVEVIDVERLAAVKGTWAKLFDKVYEDCRSNKEMDKEEVIFEKRCIIGYFVQAIAEQYMTKLVEKYDMHNVIVCGGSFYNVKLNNKIFTTIDGLYCAMPLAGDQGAAIGMYYAMTGKKFPFDTLCFGNRTLYNAHKVFGNKEKMNIVYTESASDEVVDEIARKIADGEIVNLINGPMEFGPRALCDTSSLFLPTTDNVANNNHMNNRNEVMPCAPVCTYENAKMLFGDEIDRVVGSDSFMILTHDYKKPYSKSYGGVMHKKTLVENVYTGRPQIVKEGTFMWKILKKVEEICDAKCLVNTSFNAHGRPIAFDNMEIMHNFAYQFEHARDYKKPYLYVVNNK